MQTIKHIYPLPTAKAVVVVMVILGLILGIVFAIGSGLLGGLAAMLGSAGVGAALGGFGLVSIIAFPILFAIIGFIFTIIGAWVYNVLAGFLGGIKWDYSNGTLHKLDIVSVAKIDAGLFGIFALLEGLLVGGFIAGFNPVGAIVGAIGGLIVGVILGFILGAIGTFLYNVVASLIGGYKFTFEGRGIKNVDPFSYAKVVAVLSAIYGLVQGLLSLTLFGALAGLAASNPAFAAMLASSSAGGTLGIVGVVVLVIVNLITGFIAGALAAIFYNIPANRNIGRIELDLV